MNSLIRLTAVSALVLPLTACGSIWYENDAFSTVEASRAKARTKVSNFYAGEGLVTGSKTKAPSPTRVSADAPKSRQREEPRSKRESGAAEATARLAEARDGRRGAEGHAERRRPAREASLRETPAASVRSGEERAIRTLSTPKPSPAASNVLVPSVERAAGVTPTVSRPTDPSAVLPAPMPPEGPRATATEIRNAIFRAWNGVMPTQISSMALFKVNPYTDGRFADRGPRVGDPDTVIDARRN
jgi:hypothetical protein